MNQTEQVKYEVFQGPNSRIGYFMAKSPLEALDLAQAKRPTLAKSEMSVQEPRYLPLRFNPALRREPGERGPVGFTTDREGWKPQ